MRKRAVRAMLKVPEVQQVLAAYKAHCSLRGCLHKMRSLFGLCSFVRDCLYPDFYKNWLQRVCGHKNINSSTSYELWKHDPNYVFPDVVPVTDSDIDKSV